ncbi:MAG: D-alanine--D-alanine ligase [Clostridia bacterium]|nr:D-alanine--D-alanine ligase [Clostridia bacterium]
MKIKIGVFFGGNSVEHEVSIITALQAIENIDRNKYDIIPIYITKENKMYCGNFIGDITQYKNIENLLHISSQVTLAQRDNKVILLKCNKKFYESSVYDYIDIAFPIVHGTNVEDGTLQGYLKMFNIPYVGSDVISSACGMDKYVCKCLLKDNDIPVLDCKCFTLKDYNENLENIINTVEKEFPYPVIVKPVNLGSSVGIQIAKNQEELNDAIEDAFTYSKKILIEKAIKNLREINCSVVGDYEFAEASECEEPIKTDEILSFNDKYISGGKKFGGNKSMNAGVLKLPADISLDVKQTIQELSVKTFKVLGCSGVIRIDFMIDQDTNLIYVNEVNTIPGSLSFHLWKATNLKYAELLDKLIDLSLKRNREDKNITYSFDSNILSGYSLNGLKGTKGTKM